MYGSLLWRERGQPKARQWYTFLFGITDIGQRIRAQAVSRVMWHWRPHSVLDAGCGYGLWACTLAKSQQNVTVVGIDLHLSEAVRARRLVLGTGTTNVAIVCGSLIPPETPLRGQTYDLIVCADVLEHIDDDVGVLRALASLLLPDGRLVIHVPAARHPRPMLARWFPRLAQLDYPDHVREGYLPNELRSKLGEAGLTMDQMKWTWGPASRLAVEVQALIPPRRFIWTAIATPLLAALAWCDPFFHWLPAYSAHANGLLAVASAKTRS